MISDSGKQKVCSGKTSSNNLDFRQGDGYARFTLMELPPRNLARVHILPTPLGHVWLT